MCYTYTPSMAISSPNRFCHALKKLAAEPPSTKTAMLRYLLPEIECAFASRKTRKQVWQYRAEEGLDISYKTFHRLLGRLQEKSRVTAALSGESRELTSPVVQKAAAGVGDDQLANLRRGEANRPAFHWQPTGILGIQRSNLAKNTCGVCSPRRGFLVSVFRLTHSPRS